VAKPMNPIERAEAKIFEMEGNPEPAQPVVEIVPPLEPVVVPPVEDVAAVVEPVLAPSPVEPENLVQQHSTLQGMYRKLKIEKEEILETNRLLTERLTVAPQAASSPSEGYPAFAGDGKGTLAESLQKLQDEYGEEFTNIIRSVARAEAGEMVNQRVAPVESRVQQGEIDTEQNRRDNFKSSLTVACPGWQAIYDSTEFDIWLTGNKEPLSGKTFEALFNEANDRWDATAMVNFFETYKQATAKVPEVVTEDPRAALVTPGVSNSSGGTPSAGQKKIWTRQEMNTFYKDVQTGKYFGRETEMQAIDLDIFNANREGRIQ
jgi:hypothetical protein